MDDEIQRIRHGGSITSRNNCHSGNVVGTDFHASRNHQIASVFSNQITVNIPIIQLAGCTSRLAVANIIKRDFLALTILCRELQSVILIRIDIITTVNFRGTFNLIIIDYSQVVCSRGNINLHRINHRAVASESSHNVSGRCSRINGNQRRGVASAPSIDDVLILETSQVCAQLNRFIGTNTRVACHQVQITAILIDGELTSGITTIILILNRHRVNTRNNGLEARVISFSDIGTSPSVFIDISCNRRNRNSDDHGGVAVADHVVARHGNLRNHTHSDTLFHNSSVCHTDIISRLHTNHVITRFNDVDSDRIKILSRNLNTIQEPSVIIDRGIASSRNTCTNLSTLTESGRIHAQSKLRSNRVDDIYINI